MASLSTAYAITTSTSTTAHVTLRNQIQMAVWTVAGEKRSDPNSDQSSMEFDIARRVLAGDGSISTLAIYSFATSATQQDAYTTAGNKITDDDLLSFVRNIWPQLAGLV